MNTHYKQPSGSEEPHHSAQHQDPRIRHDDPLLDSLQVLCQLQGKPASRTTLTAGLPLEDLRLPASLLPRAAARAGLRARILKRSLNAIPSMSLPAMLLLREGRAAILLGWTTDGNARLMTGETEGGEITVDHNTLQQNYLGLVMFAQPAPRFDASPATLLPRSKAWFRDTLKLSRNLYLDAAIVSLLINIIALFIPLFVMQVYDRVLPNQTTNTLWVLASGLGIALLFELIMKILRSVCLDIAGKKTDLLLSATLFERLVGMMRSVFPARIGTVAHRVRELQSLHDTLSSLSLGTLLDFPFTLLMLILLGILGGPLLWVPLLTLLLVLVINVLLQQPILTAHTHSRRLTEQRQALLTETLSGLDTIKIHNAEGERQRQWEQISSDISRLSSRAKTLSALAVHLTQTCQHLASVVMMVVGVYLLLSAQLTPGSLFACYLLNSRVLITLGTLSELFIHYLQTRLTLEETHELMALPQERGDQSSPLKRESIQGSIEFCDVTFSYPEQKNRALIDINLSIRAGEKVGIIGRTGSGKSSLEKLIVNLYQPTTGNLLIDGVDARQFDIADLRHHIGYVPQDIQLFSGTLRDNLIFGARYVEDDAMLRVADIAGVNDFARLHPDGYNLQVGERGMHLSGGQKQAVAIARALLLDPPILLLDEPTSAMDNSSEDRFKQALQAILANRTLLLVTHRVSMLTLVDRLVIVDKGRIIADGPKAIVLDALKKGQINASR
ncbi:type I secretion system permease/ATPase [Dickeya sp. CFBP 2040]|uniref:type I secretion system permease/ATPase n=1 Tax=Dickeya sp. CFBP 2040 TaxID=2718531 RepID=UPI001445CED3|nr:type I secretion system permease/ATPase [Dickeya sp. CFBP 2040]NKI75888.1 type I secretion system permease/ATPase [Dickeya sp. CFBP 2040]